jgi:hypothetical protein
MLSKRRDKGHENIAYLALHGLKFSVARMIS